MKIDWKWQSVGFAFGQFHDPEHPTVRVEWWSIPYWTIITPLTLLSAYQLLMKPRSKTSPTKST